MHSLELTHSSYHIIFILDLANPLYGFSSYAPPPSKKSMHILHWNSLIISHHFHSGFGVSLVWLL
jgi:hypothetical protein